MNSYNFLEKVWTGPKSSAHILMIKAILYDAFTAKQYGSLRKVTTIPPHAKFRYTFFSSSSLTDEFSCQYDSTPSNNMRGFCRIININMSVHRKFSA